MICPDCHGTTIRLVPVPTVGPVAWVKIGCDTCVGGYAGSPITELAIESTGISPVLPKRRD